MINLYQVFKENLEDIIKQSHEYIYIHNKKGNILDINDVVLRNLGYSKEELLKMNIKDLHSNENKSKFLRTKEPNEPRIVMMKKNSGDVIQIQEKSIPLIEKGESIFLIIGNEIPKSRISQQKLNNLEMRYHSFIEHTTDAVFCYEYDPPIPIDLPIDEQVKLMYDCILVECNIVCAKSYGYNRVEEVIGRKLTDLFGTSSNSLDELFKNLLKNKYHIVDGMGIEKLPTGEEKYYLNNGHGIIENGKLIRVWGTYRDITEKKKAEKEILKEKEFIDTALNAQRDTFFVFDPHTGKAIRWNKAFMDTSGYTDEEITHLKAPESYYNKEDLKRAAEASKEIEILENTKVIMNLITKHGKSIPFEYIGSSIYDEDGKTKYIVSIGRDISERLKTEKRIRDSETRLRTAIESLPFDFFALDKNEKYSMQNSICKKNWGDVIGKVPEEIAPDEIILKMWKKNNMRALSGEVIKEEVVFTINNETRYIYNILSPIKNKEKIQGILGINIDITEKRKAELKLKESEEKYKQLFEQSPYSISLFDEKGNLVESNRKVVQKLAGHIGEEYIGQNFIDIISHFQNSEELLKIFMKRYKSMRKKNKMDPPIEIPLISKKGEKFWLYWQSHRFFLRDKAYILVIISDITERKRAEELIIEENIKLLELDNLRRDIITRVSHELRTPLTSIYGGMYFLLSAYKNQMSSEVLENVEIAYKGSMRLKDLVENLLDISKIDANKIDFRFKNIKINDMIKDSIKELKYLANTRNLNVEYILPHNVYFKLDESKIYQAITNLLSNAIKNTPPGGKIQAILKEEDKFIDIIIKDDGVGITEKEKEMLFQKFGKIERFGKDYDVDIEGCGLGLYLSEEIVKMHGGEIIVESEGRNLGSNFTIRLYK